MTLSSCVDLSAPSGTSRQSFAIVPRFSQSASLAAAAMSQTGLTYDAVRIVIVRSSSASDTLNDTTIVFGPTSPAVTLALSVAALPAEDLLAAVEFKHDETVMFSGSATVRAVPVAVAGVATPVEVPVAYTGPGFGTASLKVQPGTGLYSASSNTQFTAGAFTAADFPVSDVPIFWSVSNPTLATITSDGLLTPVGIRGSIEVTATAANGVSTTIPIQLASAANGVRVVRGAGQVGLPGSQLPVPVTIELTAADGLPAAGTGQTVTFSASAGASITPISTTVDANGRASAMMTVGTVSGATYIFTAQVGALQVQWAATAKPGIPTHFVSSGSTTLSLTAGVTPNPVPSLRVADALENSVPGVNLRITVKEGGVDLTAPFTVIADSVGLLEVYRVAPGKAGTYTIVVETADPLGVPPVTYNVTVNPGPAVRLAFTQQPPATVTSGQPVTVQVAVLDQFGNLVTSSTQSVSIGVESGSSGWNASGSAAAIAGVATISVTITGAGTGAKIQASAGSLGAALSAAFNIIP
jgi:hypothetical protein